MAEELFNTFNKELYRINSSVYGSSDHVSTNGVANIEPSQISSGGSLEQTTQYVGATAVGKQGYTNTETGYILGIDSQDGKAKFYIGNTTNYLNWTGTALVISGNITATTGNIGGFTIGSTDLSATSGGNQTILSSGTVAFSAGPTGSPTVTITQAGVLTATGAVITGTITATSGAIGGFNIGVDYIRDAANSFGLASTVTGGNDVRFWAGDAFANRATAPLRLYEDGSIVGTNATFTGALFATSGWIGAATALVYESTGINTGTTGHIRGGQTSYNTGTGYFLGYDAGAYKLSIGDTSNYLNWDGDTLTIAGTFNIGGTNITIDNTEDIQQNLDIISGAGGGTLFLQNGTYTLTADILIPGGVTLEGVSRDGVILDCDGSFAVKIAGTNVYSTGTVTINNGDTTVVGSGTTWTAGMVGRYILLDGSWYEITARTDNTHINITEYQGDNLSGSVYVLANPNFNATVSKITIIGATGSGMVVQYAMEPNLFDLVITDNGTGIEMDYVVFPRVVVTCTNNGVNANFNYVEGLYIDYSEFSYSTTGAGVVMTNTRNGTFFNFSSSDNTGDGINATDCSKIAYISFDISGNGGQGVEFVAGCNDNQLADGVLDGNASDNLKLTASSDRNSFCQISNINAGGFGVNIAASTCDGNMVIAPAFNNNSSGNVNNNGTNTFISPQEVGSNVQTFTSSGTWTKPSTGTMALVQAWGAGASGGKGNTGFGGGGGGGGAYSEAFFILSTLGATETVTIGSGGASRTTTQTSGAAGGNTTFGLFLTAYGGGGGSSLNASQYGGGGGGGGTSAGVSVNGSQSGGAGGGPAGGAGGGSAVAGSTSSFGGGGGGGGNDSGIGAAGGATAHGGGGGGGGGEGLGGGAGGASMHGGGGGGGGASDGSPGAGAGGVSAFGGSGGAGAFDSNNATAGTTPGGGGGGSELGNSGAGGNGKLIVTTF